ncbi:MAG TPA: fibronectin type III domain-containing protein [Solirubrobacterales bacterium]|nr:fibronectin type III domain-containing protein [Solirubrobacterales bacterium]
MKNLKLLVLVAAAAAAWACITAGTVFATTLGLFTGATIVAEAEGGTVLDSPAGTIQCSESAIGGRVTNAGSSTETASELVEGINFKRCNATVSILNTGSLEYHTRETNANNNGTLTSSGLELTTEVFGTHCIFKTSNTDIGTVTGSVNTGAGATLDISGNIPRTGGRSGVFCGSTVPWTGSYLVVCPSAMNVDGASLEGGFCVIPENCSTAVPVVTTEGASFITSHAANLRGSVNPEGCATTYVFEYGTTTEYGTSISGSAGAGMVSRQETRTASGLLANTTYHYRITAENVNGKATPGADVTFTTLPEKPTVTTEVATDVTKTTAILNGSVNPNGGETSYWFEYGATAEYGKKTGSGSAGSGTSSVKENKEITELVPGTTYHFRIAANNAGGTKEGSDKTFTTTPVTWGIQTTPNPTGAKSSRLTFGSCTASTACTSVGEYVNSSGTQVPLAERWNGSAWSAETPPSPSGATASEFLGVSCTTSTACAAAGLYNESGARHALAESWNGSEWAVQTTASPSGATASELSAISCTSSTACTAVGHYTTSTSSVTLAERWNGTSWSVQTTPNPSGASESSLLGVSCTSSTACTATGYYVSSGVRKTLAEVWNGSTWSVQTTPNRTGATGNILLGVSCTSSTACTAVGGDFPSTGPQETLVERWNGASWAIQTSQNPAGSEASVLHGVSCLSATECTTVGDYVSAGVNVTLAEIWNGGAWYLQSPLNPSGATFSALWSVACTSLTECIAPGYYKDSSGTELALTERSS